MITITSVDSIRNLPATALFGDTLVIYFTFAAIVFLLPCALVAAELSAALPATGGVYLWVSTAFGKRFGLLAIWFQWIENVIWYPTILSFIAATCAYVFSPALAADPYFLCAVIIVTFWLLTFLNLLGIQSSAYFSEFCGIIGLLLPMLVIIVLGFVWYFSGKPIQAPLTSSDLGQMFSEPSLLVSLTAVFLTFSGIEIATVHAQDVKNPQRDYPIALIISVIVIYITMVLGSLAIAITVPKSDLSLVAGIMQAFEIFFESYQLKWLSSILGIAIVIGTLGGVSNWIISPSRGLLVALQDESLMPALQKTNKYGAPKGLLIMQACLVTLMSFVFLFMPSINASYWVLTVLAAQLYMLMYIMMFIAAVYLRISKPEFPRPFKVPGGIKGLVAIAGLGTLSSLLTFIIGFFPPEGISSEIKQHYELMILSSLILMASPPFLFHWWHRVKQQTEPMDSVDRFN